MPEDNLKPEAELRVMGQADHAAAIPVDVLIRTLSGMQQVVYCLAADSDDRKLEKRFRVGEDIERRYKLVCLVPQAGSYVVPFTLPAHSLVLFNANGHNLFSKLDTFFRSIAAGDREALSALFRDRQFLRRSLSEVKKLLPKADEPWKVGYRNVTPTFPQQSEIVLGRQQSKLVESWLETGAAPQSIMTVTGELTAIDFGEKKVSLIYPVNNQVINCFYTDELEEELIDSRRDLVQVTGEFVMDNHGNPYKLMDCTRIEPLDLSPISLTFVTHNGKTYNFRRPLDFVVQIDEESKQFLFIIDVNLGLNVFAATREELIDELAEQVAYLWHEFAVSDEASLSSEAIRVRNAVLEAVEVDNAA